jgi:hypothetical protein
VAECRCYEQLWNNAGENKELAIESAQRTRATRSAPFEVNARVERLTNETMASLWLTKQKPAFTAGFAQPHRVSYFFSAGVGSADFGVSVVAGPDEPGAVGGVPVAPVLPGALVSALGASPGAGVGVTGGVGAVVLGAGAAGGGVTVFSSFLLQAERPIARQATSRSERFMFYPLAQSSNVHGMNAGKPLS